LWLTGVVDQIILTLDNIHGNFSYETYVDTMLEYSNVTFIEQRQVAVNYAIDHYGNKDYLIGCLGLGDSDQLVNKNTIIPYNEYNFIKSRLNDL
jgi:hypothetical protein